LALWTQILFFTHLKPPHVKHKKGMLPQTTFPFHAPMQIPKYEQVFNFYCDVLTISKTIFSKI